jgi:hypothetical protein
MKEFSSMVQRKKTIGRIDEKEWTGLDADTTHCSRSAVELAFEWLQAGTFAKSLGGERR